MEAAVPLVRGDDRARARGRGARSPMRGTQRAEAARARHAIRRRVNPALAFKARSSLPVGRDAARERARGRALDAWRSDGDPPAARALRMRRLAVRRARPRRPRCCRRSTRVRAIRRRGTRLHAARRRRPGRGGRRVRRDRVGRPTRRTRGCGRPRARRGGTSRRGRQLGSGSRSRSSAAWARRACRDGRGRSAAAPSASAEPQRRKAVSGWPRCCQSSMPPCSTGRARTPSAASTLAATPARAPLEQIVTTGRPLSSSSR